MARVNDLPYASALYHVTSSAGLRVTTVGDGSTVQVVGKRFLPHVKFALVAYPLFKRPRKGAGPALLGFARSDRRGRFSHSWSVRTLIPGQYVLRAGSTGGAAAQTAESFFEVAI